mmetsp:Transcript_31168/g.67449  ORF Transcript_31168/g.67449 Transcript_31168/m.67449 type:complete len:113 (-) Transcript_31168:416-754(-)
MSPEEEVGVVPTSSMTFIETSHGRLRRAQRGIGKKDLKAAKKYGKKRNGYPRPNGDPVAIYEYKDIFYIMNEWTGEEVTCYSKPLELDYVPISSELQRRHDEAKRKMTSTVR